MSREAILASVSRTDPAAVPQRSQGTAAIRRERPSRAKPEAQVPLRRNGALVIPSGLLAWILGFLGAGACIAPWLAHGWLWLEFIGAGAALLLCLDASTLWAARKEFAPVLLPPERGIRGREGQIIAIPLTLSGSAKCRLPCEVRLAIMPATRESETAIRIEAAPQWLRFEKPVTTDGRRPILLWPWNPELALLRRGLWPGLRVGVERKSPFGIWALRQWFDCPEPLRIEADMRPGRREILRSPIYRSLVASRQTPWTGHGRDFERLREYQPGDNYSEIAWKSTARHGEPITRLFQWEQKQEVYFVLDQSRASALSVDQPGNAENETPLARAPRRLLDLAIETALIGATVALELGDEFGLVTYAEDPKSWLRAGSGQTQFHQFRDRLLSLEPLPTTADYEALFGAIRTQLRKRAYLVLLANAAERAVSDSLARGVGLVRSSHVVLMTSLLPPHAHPAFSSGKDPQTDADVYAALAGEKENQRLGALARQLGRWDVQLRYVPPEIFLRTAVEGYMESKREQRL